MLVKAPAVWAWGFTSSLSRLSDSHQHIGHRAVEAEVLVGSALHAKVHQEGDLCVFAEF